MAEARNSLGFASLTDEDKKAITRITHSLNPVRDTVAPPVDAATALQGAPLVFSPDLQPVASHGGVKPSPAVQTPLQQPQPPVRTNIPTTPGLPPGYVQPAATGYGPEVQATMARLGKSNQADAAQRSLMGGDTPEARFNAPTGVNAESMAAMKAQFNQMNAYTPTATRTPSIHGDESGIPKMLGPESGLGWKTRNAMYKEQMDLYQSGKTNESALAREQLSQAGATGRTGMQEAGATGRTGMQEAGATGRTGMQGANAVAVQNLMQGGENQRLAQTQQFTDAQGQKTFERQGTMAANQLKGAYIQGGGDPNEVGRIRSYEGNVTADGAPRLPLRNEQENFTTNVLPGADGAPSKLAVTGTRSGQTRMVDPAVETPAGNNLAGQPPAGGSAQQAKPQVDYKQATDGMDNAQLLEYATNLRRTNPEAYQVFRSQVKM